MLAIKLYQGSSVSYQYVLQSESVRIVFNRSWTLAIHTCNLFFMYEYAYILCIHIEMTFLADCLESPVYPL